MNYNKLVAEYIKGLPEEEPIFMTEIKEYMKRYCSEEEEMERLNENINVIVNRLNKEGKINRLYKGIYYKKLNKDRIIERKYIRDKDGKIKGYITGKALLKELGLYNGEEGILQIVSNECKLKNSYKNDVLNIIVKKPKIEITNENYRYLIIIDAISNINEINVDKRISEKKIYNFIKEYNLNFEKIIKYAKETKNKKVIDVLYEIAK